MVMVLLPEENLGNDTMFCVKSMIGFSWLLGVEAISAEVAFTMTNDQAINGVVGVKHA